MRRDRGQRVALRLTVGVLALAVGSASLHAQQDGSPLAPIRELVSELKYVEAAEAIPGVFEAGGLSAAETAAAYRLGGEVFASLGDADAARDYFERWLLLVPDGRLPDGVSPKIAAPFEAARERVDDSGPLRARPVVTRTAGAVRVELAVESDPGEMIAGLRVAYGLGDAPADQVEQSDELALEIAVPGTEEVRLLVAATDEHGNELIAEQATAAAAVGAPAATGGRARPWYARWYTWAGVAGASAGAGVLFGMRARSDADELDALNADSSSHSYAEARAIERRGKRNALLANIGFGAAGAAAVVAVIFAWRGTTEESAPAVEPMVGDDVAGLSWRMSF